MKSISLSITAIWLAISPLSVQSTPAWPPIMPFGIVKGVVRDAYTNQPLQYANVTIASLRNGAMSQADGSFTICFVPAGSYKVTTMMMGFSPVSYYRVVVRMGTVTELSFSLEEKPREWSGTE